MSKWLKLEIAFGLLSACSFLISRFDPNKNPFWLGVILGIVSLVGLLLLKIGADGRKKEICLQIKPRDWFLEKTKYRETRLEIDARKHGRGSNISVRWEFPQGIPFDLEYVVDNGNITIKYKRNNYPANPKIPLLVYISGRELSPK